jgi:uncharacterized protein (DUF58 family)
MGRLLLLGGLIYGLFFVGLATLSGGLLALALPLAVYLAAALLYAPEPPRLRIVRELSSERIMPGAAVEVKLSLRNEGRQLEEVLVEDILPQALDCTDGEVSKVVVLPPDQAVELTYSVKGPRGRYEFKHTRVTAGDHLGVFRRQVTLASPGAFIVLPEVLRMRQVAIRPLRTRASTGLIPARLGGPGIEFFGVREYQSGDSLRWINWRVTARQPRRIFTNEFEQERIADVGLILDARLRSDVRWQGASLFEHSVRATAALAEVFLHDANRVALLVYGSGLNWVFPGYGHVQRERIMQALARAQTGESEVFESLEYLPTRLFPARSQIVLVSPLADDDLPMLVRLRAHGYELLVISPDPVAFENCASILQDGALPAQPDVALAGRIARLERAVMLRRLRQTGAQIVDWRVDQPFDRAVLASLGRVPRLVRAGRPG